MSGWTCITVEPEQTSEEQFATYKRRSRLNQLASQLIAHEEPAVGREDLSVDTQDDIDTLNELQREVEHALAETGEIDAEEMVEAWLKEWSADFFNDDHALLHHTTPTVQYPSRGQELPGVAEEILTNCPRANRVLIIHANDTSDSGVGYLYRMSDGEFEKVDEWAGYEGAVGSDVQGYFREEYHISGRARPY